MDVLSLLYPHLLFALDQPRIVPHKTKGAFTKLHRVGVLSAIVAFLISLLACNDARADELINLLMYARGKGVDAVGLRSFIMSHGGINECIEATAGKVRM